MASILMEYLRIVICLSVRISIVSGSRVDCTEVWAMPCNSSLRVTGTGDYTSAIYEISNSTDICRLYIRGGTTYQSITLRCLEDAPRIVFSIDRPISSKRLLIKNCVIYWKDMRRLGNSVYYIEDLNLDDYVDEFGKGESQYFVQCVVRFSGKIPGFYSVGNINLLSSVVRPLSEVFIRSTIWSKVWSLSIQG